MKKRTLLLAVLAYFPCMLANAQETKISQTPDLATKDDVRKIQKEIRKSQTEIDQHNKKAQEAVANQLNALSASQEAAAKHAEETRRAEAERQQAEWHHNQIVLRTLGLSGLILLMVGVLLVRRVLRDRSASVVPISGPTDIPQKKTIDSFSLGIDPEPRIVEGFLKTNGLEEAQFTTILRREQLVFVYTGFLRNEKVFAYFQGQDRHDATLLCNRHKLANELYQADKLQPLRAFSAEDLEAARAHVVN